MFQQTFQQTFQTGAACAFTACRPSRRRVGAIADVTDVTVDLASLGRVTVGSDREVTTAEIAPPPTRPATSSLLIVTAGPNRTRNRDDLRPPPHAARRHSDRRAAETSLNIGA